MLPGRRCRRGGRQNSRRDAVSLTAEVIAAVREPGRGPRLRLAQSAAALTTRSPCCSQAVRGSRRSASRWRCARRGCPPRSRRIRRRPALQVHSPRRVRRTGCGRRRRLWVRLPHWMDDAGGQPPGPAVAISHQTMRRTPSMNSGSKSANDETRIDNPCERVKTQLVACGPLGRVLAGNDICSCVVAPLNASSVEKLNDRLTHP